MAVVIPSTSEHVGSESWREATYGTIRMARDLVEKSGRVVTTAPVHQTRPRRKYAEEISHEGVRGEVAEKKQLSRSGRRSVDVTKPAPAGDAGSKDTDWISSLPLPFFRDFLAMQSNSLVHDYSRQTRVVLARLQRAISYVNDELCKLLKEKEALEHTLANVRKDILTNKQSVTLRSFRPISEKDSDKADALIVSERAQLLKLKMKLEEDLATTHQQLQALGLVRQLLRDCAQERNRVLDLINHSMTGVLRDYDKEVNMRRSPLCSLTEKTEPQKVNPFEPLNTECKEAIDMVLPTCDRSQDLRKNIREHIKEAVALQEALNKSVNDNLKQKTLETLALKSQLQLTSGELRKMKHYCQRLYDDMDTTHGFALGPVYSGDLEARERLDRPVVRIYQRHVGTQLPESTELTKGTILLQNAIKNMNNDIDRLHATRLRVEDNIRDKRIGYNVDSSIIHLRRRRADHRWPIDQGKQLICD
ncbi:tektin-like protein 1 [Microcaecilia unicolor]|uniref:Coiled-coil domain-containing protein 105 n=1 Tax=Microcaecilia unicolor TaxID=1415580 RepID=A0A6P7XFI6_9AMPH|nr:coiled-coil domain-containing protein 105 [Microcaecilia unicolor]